MTREIRHGTKYRYDKGCRCFWCREASNAAHQKYRERARARRSPAYLNELEATRARKETYRGTCRNCGGPTSGANGPGTAPELCQACYLDTVRALHGAIGRYQRGCRCDRCRAVNAEKQRNYRRRLAGGGGSSPPRPPTPNAS